MNFFFPMAAAILQASSYVLDKVTLSLRGVSYRTYIGVSFPISFFVLLSLFVIFHPPLSASLIYSSFGLLVLSIAVTFLTNFSYYRALDHDALSEIEVLDLFSKIPVILWAALFFPDERKIFVIIPALIASLAVFWSHFEHHRFKLSKFTRQYFILAVTVIPFGSLISKELLKVWNPISFDLVRTLVLALIFMTIYVRQYKEIRPKSLLFIFITNVLTTIAWILYYFSFKISGINYTILLFSLQPLLVYLAALLFLREKFHWKKATAFAVVLVAILIAQSGII